MVIHVGQDDQSTPKTYNEYLDVIAESQLTLNVGDNHFQGDQFRRNLVSTVHNIPPFCSLYVLFKSIHIQPATARIVLKEHHDIFAFSQHWDSAILLKLSNEYLLHI